jgi:hypothetical protein
MAMALRTCQLTSHGSRVLCSGAAVLRLCRVSLQDPHRVSGIVADTTASTHALEHWQGRQVADVGMLLFGRIGGRLAGRMAPRYVKDKFTGHTMQMAFHDADTGMTQTVAK